MGAPQPASVFPALEKLLPRVSKPIQYVGGELNAQVKPWGGDETVRWCLMYPDAYEVGLPNQGVMILYEVLNEQPDTLAERTYSVWPDLAALMREHGSITVGPDLRIAHARTEYLEDNCRVALIAAQVVAVAPGETLHLAEGNLAE